MNNFKIFLLLLLFYLLPFCSTKKINYPSQDQQTTTPPILITQSLFNVTLEIISDSIPLALVEPQNQLIVSEWLEDGTNQQVQLSASVVSTENPSEDLTITLTRQQKDHSGNWQNQPLTPDDQLLISELKQKIIDKAKFYR